MCPYLLNFSFNGFEARRIGHDIKEQQELQVFLTAPEFRKYNAQTIFLDFGFFFQFFKPGAFAAGTRGFV